VITGPKPVNTPSLNDDENEFLKIANKLWSDEKGMKETGKGKVYVGYTIGKVLNDLKLKPDFTYKKKQHKSNNGVCAPQPGNLGSVLGKYHG